MVNLMDVSCRGACGWGAGVGGAGGLVPGVVQREGQSSVQCGWTGASLGVIPSIGKRKLSTGLVSSERWSGTRVPE